MNDVVDRGPTLSVADPADGAVKAIPRAGRAEAGPDDGGDGATEEAVRLTEAEPSFAALFPSTRYFEVQSRIAGTRFSAWVTLPALYDLDKSRKFPVLYQVDGNLFFPATAPFVQAGHNDVMSPQTPFILVSVGYSVGESHAWPWRRVRDLLPPGEPVPEAMRQALQRTVEAGLLPTEEGDRYLAMFAEPAGDRFLGFLERELHPLVSDAFRADGDDVGLWGDSYGGLFAAYVAISRSDLFNRQSRDRREG